MSTGCRLVIAGLALATTIGTSVARPVGVESRDVSIADDEGWRCGGPTGWRRFVCDSRAVGRRLALREPGDGTRAATIAGAAGLLFAARETIRDSALRGRSESRSARLQDGRLISRGALSPLLAGGYYLAGRVSGNARYRESSQILLESTFYSYGLAAVGQAVLASERPEDGTAVRFLRPDGHGVSADVVLAGSVVSVIDRRHLRRRPGEGPGRRALKGTARGVLYSALAATALQRLDSDQHWAPDVFLGAAAGLGVGFTLCAAHESEGRGPGGSRSSRRGRVQLGPNGARVVWTF